MNTIELKNSFHGTSVRVRTEAEDAGEAWLEIQAAVYATGRPTAAAKRGLRRVERTLCGMSDCQCGTFRP